MKQTKYKNIRSKPFLESLIAIVTKSASLLNQIYRSICFSVDKYEDFFLFLRKLSLLFRFFSSAAISFSLVSFKSTQLLFQTAMLLTKFWLLIKFIEVIEFWSQSNLGILVEYNWSKILRRKTA